MSFFWGDGGSAIHHPKRALTNADADKGSNLILHLFLVVILFTACTMVIRHHETHFNSSSYVLSSLRMSILEPGGGFKYFLVIYFRVFCSVRIRLLPTTSQNPTYVPATGGVGENSSNKIPHGFLHQPQFGFV